MIRNLLFLEDGKKVARVEITYEKGEKPIAKFVEMLKKAFEISETEPNLQIAMKDFKLVIK